MAAMPVQWLSNAVPSPGRWIYGVFLWGDVVLQLMVHAHFQHANQQASVRGHVPPPLDPILVLFVSMPLSMIIGLVSFNVVERPCQRAGMWLLG
jgi:peptidoglycan/LPS O-acetylase OafA/YrhL